MRNLVLLMIDWIDGLRLPGEFGYIFLLAPLIAIILVGVIAQRNRGGPDEM